MGDSIVRIAVGSTSTTKINAVCQAGRRLREHRWEVEGVKVDSCTPDQPMTEHQTIVGAVNRALGALSNSSADYAFGIESGINRIDGRWFDCAWVVCISSLAFDAPSGIASTLRMPVPYALMGHIYDGHEMAIACELHYGVPDGKVHGNGLFEQHSDMMLNRTDTICDAVVAAYKDLIKQSSS